MTIESFLTEESVQATQGGNRLWKGDNNLAFIMSRIQFDATDPLTYSSLPCVAQVQVCVMVIQIDIWLFVVIFVASYWTSCSCRHTQSRFVWFVCDHWVYVKFSWSHRRIILRADIHHRCTVNRTVHKLVCGMTLSPVTFYLFENSLPLESYARFWCFHAT